MCSRRFTVATGLLISLGLATAQLGAQRTPPLASVTYEEVTSVGTPDEAPLLRALSARLRARFADATFVKRVHDAIAHSKMEEAVRLISEAVQEPGAEVEIVEPEKSSSLFDTPAPTLVRYAAHHRDAPRTLNPWYFVIRTGYAFVFICSTKRECIRGRHEFAR